ncbi:hypothetical protein Tco_1140731 [Tanacetum coccineum]
MGRIGKISYRRNAKAALQETTVRSEEEVQMCAYMLLALIDSVSKYKEFTASKILQMKDVVSETAAAIAQVHNDSLASSIPTLLEFFPTGHRCTGLGAGWLKRQSKHLLGSDTSKVILLLLRVSCGRKSISLIQNQVILKVFPESLTLLTLPENVPESAPRFDDDFPSIPEGVSGGNSHVTQVLPRYYGFTDDGIVEQTDSCCN